MRKDVLSLLLSASLICTMMPVEGVTQRASAAERNASGVEVSVKTAEEGEAEVTVSGTFGGEVDETGTVTKEDTHKWSFVEATGILTISGEGDMPAYTASTYTGVPWYAYRDKIQKVVFAGNVTKVGDYAFYLYSALKEVDLTGATGLTVIGDHAFHGCSVLAEVKGIQQLTEIGTQAFYNTGLYGELSLPNITELNGSFEGTKITSVTMPNLTTISGVGAFQKCKELKVVDMPELTTISGNNAFAGCTALTTVQMPKLATATGSNSFQGCSALIELSFPELTEVGNYFVSGTTSLQTLSVPMLQKAGNYAFENTGLIELSLPELTTPGNVGMFRDNMSLMKVSMPKVTTWKSFFENCQSLVYLELPEQITSIGTSNVFKLCDSLQRIYMKGEPAATIPIAAMAKGYGESYQTVYHDAVVYVPSDAAKTKWSAYTTKMGEDKVQVVSDWSALKKECDLRITMADYDIDSPVEPVLKENTAGSTVKYCYYEQYADSQNNSSKRMRLIDEENPEAKPTKPGDYYVRAYTEETDDYFGTTSNYAPFTVYGDVVGDGWVYNNKSTILTITDAKVMDTEYASYSEVPWYEYSAVITAVEVADGVELTKIAPNAFAYMRKVESIDLPDTLDSVGQSAFMMCAVWNRTEPLKIKELGSGAFSYCYQLACPVVLEEGITTVPNQAFMGANKIPSVQVPDTVTSFGSSCFSSCYGIREIHIPDGVTELPDGFIQNAGITEFDIPEQITSIGANALSGLKITSVTLPLGLTSLGKGAFSNCTLLESITLPAGLTTLKAGTFQNMTGLKRICIPSTVTEIEGATSNGSGLFSGCKNLELVVFDRDDYTTDNLGMCGSNSWYDSDQDGKNDIQAVVDQMFNNTNDSVQVVCDGTTYDTLKTYAETNTYWSNWKPTTNGWTSSKVLHKPAEYQERFAAEQTAAENLQEADYKAELWRGLQTALVEAEELAQAGDTIYQKVINQMDAMKTIQNAVRSFLVDTYKGTDRILESDYYDPEISNDEETDAWYAYVDALDAAKTILEDDSCTVEEYAAYEMELREAMAAIIPLPTDDAVQALDTVLGSVQKELEVLKEVDYTAESWKALQDAVKEAQEIREDGTISQVEAAQKRLEEAKEALTLAPVDDAKAALSNVLKEVEVLKEADYTVESWKALQDAVEEAKALSDTATLSEVQAAQKKIEDAKKALEKSEQLSSPSPAPGQNPSGNTPAPGQDPSGNTPAPGQDPSGNTPAPGQDISGNTPAPGQGPSGNTPAPGQNPSGSTQKVTVKKVTMKKVSSRKKKTALVQWKKLSGVTGYQIQLGTDKKITKGKKTVTVKKAKTVETTVKKLKSKKKYYVRVRAYKTVDGKKYYGSWSKIKTVKIK